MQFAATTAKVRFADSHAGLSSIHPAPQDGPPSSTVLSLGMKQPREAPTSLPCSSGEGQARNEPGRGPA